MLLTELKPIGASPVVISARKDGTLRFHVNYRIRNAAAVQDCYPVARMDECLEYTGDAHVF